jgi:hypothetical protein
MLGDTDDQLTSATSKFEAYDGVITGTIADILESGEFKGKKVSRGRGSYLSGQVTRVSVVSLWRHPAGGC